jgi:hypothetical protein
MDRPFVYISALMRTGSTALSEALTQLPDSFIFHETHLGKNTFSVSTPDQAQLSAYGVDLRAFLRLRLPVAFLLRRLRAFRPVQDFMIKEVKRVLIPRLQAIGMQQIGCKEIKHRGWEHVVQHFPDLKMVMLGRDPRDVYISAYRKWLLGTTAWRGRFTPRTAARRLEGQFTRQMQMRDHVECLTIRYEDLCTDPAVLQCVIQFTHSPVTGTGEIGRYLRSDPKRRHEYDLHGREISRKSVFRWRHEVDRKLLAQANEFSALMPRYTSFWGYHV